jgi:hypothetical protein
MGDNVINQIEEYVKSNVSDISSHLPSIFNEIFLARQKNSEFKVKLIVELGVCSGQSTYIFDTVNQVLNSQLVSVDIDVCEYNNVHNGTFIHEDDIIFANRFEAYCIQNDLPTKINVLFIDTSHLYEHTKQEIEKWFPFLNDNALVIFHDTNMPCVYHVDNAIKSTWNNDRGVIRAIEEYFGFSVFEQRPFKITNVFKNGSFWNFDHRPESNGLTFIHKSPHYYV